MKICLIVASAFLLFLSGCTNNFQKFYINHIDGKEITKSKTLIPPTGEPQLKKGTNIKLDMERMWENGYFLIGESSFNSGEVKLNGALLQAKRVHAEIVAVYSNYTNTESGSVPLTLPSTQTSQTNVYGNVDGANFYGTGQTTTYGSTTQYIPYNTRRYEYHALYWVKHIHPALGVLTVDLTQTERQRFGSNKGVRVNIVMKDSPAWKADILKGDIITKIEGTEIENLQDFTTKIRSFLGKSVAIEFYRNSARLVKSIKLRSSNGLAGNELQESRKP